MSSKLLTPEKVAIIREMNELMCGLTLDELQVLVKGKPFRFPVFAEMDGMDQDVSAMDLTVRSQNALRRSNMKTVRDVVENVSSEADLMKIRNMGVLSIREVLFSIFLYQFSLFNPAGKKKYMLRVLEMNGVVPARA